MLDILHIHELYITQQCTHVLALDCLWIRSIYIEYLRLGIVEIGDGLFLNTLNLMFPFTQFSYFGSLFKKYFTCVWIYVRCIDLLMVPSFRFTVK